MKEAGPLTRPIRILFLSGWQIHPTGSGGTLRSFALASSLARHGCEVSVHSRGGRKADYLARRPSSVQRWPEGIEEYVDRGVLGFLAQYGSQALKLPPFWLTAHLWTAAGSPRDALLPPPLRAKLAWCDVIVADFPFVHPVFEASSARGKLRVLSTHNIEHEVYGVRGFWNRRRRAALRAIELRAARSCDLLVSCCESDQRFFEANAPVRQAVVVPNGIDVRRFRGVEANRAATRQALGIRDDERMFLFTASRWGPNREAFDYLEDFARHHGAFLAEQRIRIVVVGNIVSNPVLLPGFTATGVVDLVEPYFGAADAALNPMFSGAGTNVKMCEFLAMRLPILSTRFGARGFDIEDGRTGFLFEKETFASVLARVRRLLDEESALLRGITAEAYARNEARIDMDACVRPLANAIAASLPEARGSAQGEEGAPPPAAAGSAPASRART